MIALESGGELRLTAEIESQGFFHLDIAFEGAANRVLPHRDNHGLFFEDGFILVVELKLDSQFLILFNSVYSGYRKPYAPSGYVIHMNDPAANSTFADDLLGAR